MAVQQPDATSRLENSSAALLMQSVAVQDSINGVNAVVLVGDPCSDAVVLVKKTAGLFCLSCSAQRACRHVKAFLGDTASDMSNMNARQAAMNQKFAEAFDSAGSRRIISVSQVSCLASALLQQVAYAVLSSEW